MIGQEQPKISVLSLRKAEVIDADKVRYLVYRTANDFVAVIAESALMAIKVSGIENPHRVVRDLPTGDIAIAAERMVKVDAAQEKKVPLRVEPHALDTGIVKVKLAETKPTPPFTAMTMGDFKSVWEKKYAEEHEKAAHPEVEEFVTVEPPSKEAATEQAVAAAEEAPPPVADVPAPDGVLSPEEVDRLLTQ